jgi:hypothetical protein
VSEMDEIRFSKMKLKGEELVEGEVRLIKQSDIQKCPWSIMVPEHYREDGSCKCNDPEHRAMMIREWGYSEGDFK